jgi:DNA polymerase-3 subunit delta'
MTHACSSLPARPKSSVAARAFAAALQPRRRLVAFAPRATPRWRDDADALRRTRGIVDAVGEMRALVLRAASSPTQAAGRSSWSRTPGTADRGHATRRSRGDRGTAAHRLARTPTHPDDIRSPSGCRVVPRQPRPDAIAAPLRRRDGTDGTAGLRLPRHKATSAAPACSPVIRRRGPGDAVSPCRAGRRGIGPPLRRRQLVHRGRRGRSRRLVTEVDAKERSALETALRRRRHRPGASAAIRACRASLGSERRQKSRDPHPA